MGDRGERGGDLEPALAALPLFPLPNAVLFPGCPLPLHVFEPRYRALVRDALDGNRALAVPMITDLGSTIDEHGHPPIATIAGAGLIVEHVELPDGRYDILLLGRARVELEELPFVTPYRRARARVVPTGATEVRQADVAAMISSATSFASLLKEREPSATIRLPRSEGADVGTIADRCAHQLVLDARERQKLLETLDVGARVRRVTEVLAVQTLALAGDRGPVN